MSWRSTRASPSFFSLLEELEQRLPFDPLLEGGDFWGTLGLQPVRELKWVTDPPSRLKVWLRQCLNVGLLGKRLRLVLEYPDILQKWYEPYGLLKNVDAVDDFISIIAALNAVSIDLSLDPNVSFELETKLILFLTFYLQLIALVVPQSTVLMKGSKLLILGETPFFKGLVIP